MDKTITLEINKFKNKEEKKIFEWTKTFEINYSVNKNHDLYLEEKTMIQNEIELKKYSLQNKKNNTEKTTLINTQILEMEGNPFHQPLMNTFEFSISEDLQINLSSNSKEPITLDEKLIALQKLLDEKIIDKEDFDIQKKQLLVDKK